MWNYILICEEKLLIYLILNKNFFERKKILKEWKNQKKILLINNLQLVVYFVCVFFGFLLFFMDKSDEIYCKLNISSVF